MLQLRPMFVVPLHGRGVKYSVDSLSREFWENYEVENKRSTNLAFVLQW